MDKHNHARIGPHGRHMARPAASRRRAAHAAVAAATLLLTSIVSHAATPAELQATYSRAAGQPPSANRGHAFFVATHGKDWSCSSCHGQAPVQPGRHTVTGKPIEPLAPSAHAPRFTDAAKVEKWFRRNCNDVLGRECSAAEKADVMAWLATLQPSR